MCFSHFFQSLDDSIVSVGGASDDAQQQLDALRAELADRNRAVTALEEEQLLWQQERTSMQQDMKSLKDKFNVSEVCVCTRAGENIIFPPVVHVCVAGWARSFTHCIDMKAN